MAKTIVTIYMDLDLKKKLDTKVKKLKISRNQHIVNLIQKDILKTLA